MSQAAYNRYYNQRIGDDAGAKIKRTFGAVVHLTDEEAVAADADGVIAAFNCTDAKTTKTTGFEAMPYPRNITATVAATTAANIKAVQVKITGTDASGAVITEDLPAFTDDTPGIVAGNLAFASVTKVEVPAMDGACTVAIGWGDKCGLGFLLPHNTVTMCFVNNAREATAPTVATSATVLAANTADPHSALAGTPVDIYLTVPAGN